MNSAREQEQNELLLEAARLYAKEAYSQAFRIYRKLADSGHPESQVFLGWMFAEGKGVETSQKDAAKWFRRAALLGSAKGAFYMGRLLASEAKYADAVLWYQRSAADGYPPSQFRLGVSYLRGEGVQKASTWKLPFASPSSNGSRGRTATSHLPEFKVPTHQPHGSCLTRCTAIPSIGSSGSRQGARSSAHRVSLYPAIQRRSIPQVEKSISR